MDNASRFIGVTISCPAATAYDFIVTPENLPRWASGLGEGSRNADGSWTSVMEIGEVTVTFAPKNDLGVCDHDVTLPNGTTFHNPMRVTPNGTDRCDVSFTLMRQPGVDDAAFEKDAATIVKDLETLKNILEAA
jgi:hypothetical protein